MTDDEFEALMDRLAAEGKPYEDIELFRVWWNEDRQSFETAFEQGRRQALARQTKAESDEEALIEERARIVAIIAAVEDEESEGELADQLILEGVSVEEATRRLKAHRASAWFKREFG